MPSTVTQVVVAGAPWWNGGVFALAGAAVGGLGTYFAQRRQDRRARRAAILTTFGQKLDTVIRLLPTHPDTAVESLWPLGHDVWCAALATAPKDARMARAILEANVALSSAVEKDRPKKEDQTYGDYSYDGKSLTDQIEAVGHAITQYLFMIGRAIGSVGGDDMSAVLSPRPESKPPVNHS